MTEATFVFRGTVKRRRAATVAHLPADTRTVTVSVDDILEAPAALAQLSGHTITVRVAGRRVPPVGRTTIFHTNGWIFGDSVAVRSVREEPVRPAHAAMLSRGGDPVAHRREREMGARFDRADVVVSGRVRAVRLPEDAVTSAPGGVRAAARGAPAPVRPASEHDPHWREAVIDVEEVHKGDLRGGQIVLTFPASIDVRWYKAPKFQPGERGTFMVHETTTAAPERRPPARGARATRAAAAPLATRRIYTALSPLDFQPQHEPGGLHALIQLRHTGIR